ncbi:uncharacterized protein LOC125376772 [Haliotis rufescens]|uniref:uncharacterized protein LOC125376772 n=1 Tax=Haliotis rufescens TaxID=6454 RepID=UPI00201F1DA2|nr:uncharacterized protein LOC125376772 [Haliotis rufescens]
MALRVILLLVMAFLAQSDRVSERKVSSWPRGNYGLLSTVYGCPETSEYGWQTGYINLTSTGSRTAYHDWSDSLHLLGPYHLHTIQLNFCMRPDDLDTEDDEILNVTENRTASSNIWPQGHYCIFQGDADCPSEFNTSFLTLRDYAIINDDIEGQLPNMTFNENEVIVILCCRSDEDANSTMALPSVFPFYLIKPQSEVPCQQVGGTEVFEETFAFIPSTNMSQDELEPHENDTLALRLCFYKPYGMLIDI